MDREKIISTVQEIPSDTRVRAWVFEIDKKFYQAVEYDRHRLGPQTGIWESNKKGKRTSPDCIFNINGKDHLGCIEKFLDKVELDSIA